MINAWPPLIPQPNITPYSVDIIGCSLTNIEHIAENWPLLSTHEQQRAQSFKFAIHRERFILAHGYLRQILARYLSCDPTKIEFETHLHGKPYVKNNPDLQFNLSHSESCMLLGLTHQIDIGVDIEHMQMRDLKAIAKRFFSADEWQQLELLSEPDLLTQFYLIWVQKEAYIKATGLGLSTELQSFSVRAKPAGLIEPNDKTWTIQTFPSQENFASAFATRQIVNKINFWRFSEQ